VEIDPMFVDARFNLGRIAERLGDRETARAQYRRVLATSPMHQPARAALAALEAGRPAIAERPPPR
jgi:TolA-binding protein